MVSLRLAIWGNAPAFAELDASERDPTRARVGSGLTTVVSATRRTMLPRPRGVAR